MLYRIIDIFFIVFHSSLVVFNLFGWIWKRTRVANLIVLLLTGSSWLFLGLLAGTPGYCPLTEWHFNVLERMGKTDLPSSYIKYLADRITNLDLNSSLIDNITLYSYLGALVISMALTIKNHLKRKEK